MALTSNHAKPFLVHIGMHKTGTTWLQNTLFANTMSGFAPLGGSPKKLGDLFVRTESGSMLSPFESPDIERINRLVAEYPIPDDCVPVISNERLSGNPHSGFFDSPIIARRLRTAFPNARIFVVIREQRSMTVSAYFQYLKRGGVHDIVHYITTPYDGAIPKFTPDSLMYDGLIKCYQGLFGQSNVLVLPYEMLQESPTDFIDKLQQFSGTKNNSLLAVNPQTRYNDPNLQVRAARFMLKGLNSVRRSSSLNDHSRLALPGLRGIGGITQNLVSQLISRDKAENIINRIHAQTDALLGDRYVSSNTKTADLIGIDIKNLYGYK